VRKGTESFHAKHKQLTYLANRLTAHESLAWTFGWLLCIAISVNAIFYLAIFAVLTYFIDVRRSRTE
jgi:hypothetical protein